jgi:hypothetical protein
MGWEQGTNDGHGTGAVYERAQSQKSASILSDLVESTSVICPIRQYSSVVSLCKLTGQK